jgi:hypothetical protein
MLCFDHGGKELEREHLIDKSLLVLPLGREGEALYDFLVLF